MENPNDPGQKLVVARVFETSGVANIALTMLRANGIECILDNEILANIFGLPMASFGGINLLVHQCDLQEALRLLGPDDYPQD